MIHAVNSKDIEIFKTFARIKIPCFLNVAFSTATEFAYPGTWFFSCFNTRWLLINFQDLHFTKLYLIFAKEMPLFLQWILFKSKHGIGGWHPFGKLPRKHLPLIIVSVAGKLMPTLWSLRVNSPPIGLESGSRACPGVNTNLESAPKKGYLIKTGHWANSKCPH